MGGSIDYIDDAGREWTHASRYRVLEEENAALRKRVEELEQKSRDWIDRAYAAEERVEKAEREVAACDGHGYLRDQISKLQADLDAALLVCGSTSLDEPALEAAERVRELLAEREAKRGGWICANCGHSEQKEREVLCWNCGKGEMVYDASLGFPVVPRG